MCGALPVLLGLIRQKLPLLQIRLSIMETPQQIAAIAEAKLDLGLIRPRPAYPGPVRTIPLFREPMMLALATTNPLADRRMINAADLAGETFINPQFHADDELGAKPLRLSEIGGFSLGPVIQVNDFVSAVSMAAGGYGVVLAPDSLRNIKLGGLVFREISDYHESVEIALAYRDDHASSAAQAIVTLLEQQSGNGRQMSRCRVRSH